MNSKILICIAAIVVIATAVATVVIASDGGEKEVAPEEGKTTRLTVLGNADLDDDIDEDDISAIQYIIDHNGTVEQYPYADADNSTKIDSKDIDFVRDMIAQKEQRIHYINVDGEIASVKYPLTGTIIATYNKTVEALRTLGCSSQIVATDDFTYKWPTYFPEFMDLPSIGNRFTPNVEKILDLDADAYLCGTTKWFASTLETDLGASSRTDVVRLPTWEEGQVLSGMVTLGYILQKEEQAAKYLDWAEGILDKVNSVVSGKSDSQKPTVLVLDADKVTSTKKAGSGQYENSIRAGGYNIVKDIGSDSEYYSNLTMEWILEKDPRFIIFSQGNTAYEWTDARMNEKLDALKTEFSRTSASQNGDIHIINLEVFIGPSYPIGVLYMAKWFYPDEFADVDADRYLQEYITEFCGLDWNVESHGGFAI